MHRLRLLATSMLTLSFIVYTWIPAALAAPELAPPSLPTLHREGHRLVAGAGSLAEYDGLRVLHVRGTPMEMGIQHGLLLGEVADELRSYVDPSMQSYKGMESLLWAFRNFYLDTKLLPTFTRNMPQRYLDEMRGFVYGISGGEDTDFKPVLIGNVFQELALMMCTSVAAWGPATSDGGLYHARNLDNDLPMALTQSALVMIVEPAGRLPFITLSYPANFGIMHAMNSKGISVSMNYSFTPDASVDGMPFVFLLREIVERAETLEQALEIVKGTPKTIGLNILIGDANIPRAVVVEVSANRYAVRETGTGFIAATNHYVSEVMKPHQQSGWHTSALRDSRLAELSETGQGHLSAAAMAEILRDKFAPGSLSHEGFLRGIENSSTMASVVMDPGRQVMWVGVQDEAAPAPERALQAFSLAAALAGEEPRQPHLDIPLQDVDESYRQDWLRVYQAERAMSQGQYAKALSQLTPLLTEYPQAEYILYLVATLHMRQGNDQSAGEYFGRIVALSQIAEPRRLQEATYYLGVLADRQGKREEALSWYRRSLAVEVPDLSGDTERLRRLARTGLSKPLGKAESLLRSWWTAQVFTGTQQVPPVPEGQVAAISILGAHRTRPDWITSWLGIQVGDTIRADRIRTMQKALLDLNAFDGASVVAIPLDRERVHLVIRIQEGFGFFKDPVELAISTAVGLSEQTLSLRYDNLLGRAVNVGGTLGWGPGRQRLAFVEGPLRLAGPNRLRLQGESRVASMKAAVGRYAGTILTLERRGVQLGLTRVMTPSWTLGVKSQWFEDTLRDVSSPQGYTPPEGHYMLLSAGLSRLTGTQARGSALSLSGGALQSLSAAGRPLARLTAGLDMKTPISANMQAMAGISAGWADPQTPLAYQFRLGGSGTLRGYGPTIATTGYGHGTLELRRYMRSDLHAALFADAASVDSGDGKILSMWSPGLAIRYRTPVGPSAVATLAYAPDRGSWRLNTEFTTAW